MLDDILGDGDSSRKQQVSKTDDALLNSVTDFSKSGNVWIDRNETNRFLKILGRGYSNDTIRSRTFGKGGGTPIKNDLKFDIATSWQNLRQGVYIVVNKGGDTDASIKECIALFCEWDDRPIEWQRTAWKELNLPEPSMQVFSGGKSLHNYWVLDKPIDADRFRDLQKRLSQHCSSDPQLSNPSRVMRLAGCTYFDKEGKELGRTTIETSNDNVYAAADFEEFLPTKEQSQQIREVQDYRQPDSDWESRPYEEIEAALACVPARVSGNNTYAQYRNLLWGLQCALEEIGRSKDEAVSMMELHSPSGGNSNWNVAQVARYKSDKAWSGWFWKIAASYGYDLTRSKRKKTQPRMPSIPTGKDISELTVDDILGPVEDDKLRNPRADRLRLLMQVAYNPKFNELTQSVEIDGKPVKSADFKTFYLNMAEDLMVNIQKDRAIDALVTAARKNSYHPVRDYLNQLADRCQPLGDDDWELIAHTIFGADDPNANMFLQRQLIGLIARVMRPGCKFDTALVIHSDDQGIGKSEFWSVMGGDWFSDSLGSLKQVKDDLMILHRAWIHEWGEIDRVFGKTASENLKHFLTIKTDHFRPPYGGAVDAFDRQCGIVGTTNSNEFIKDPTGNRRFPCFTANNVDLDWVRRHRDAIWLRCLNEFNAGTRYWYEGDELQIINDIAQQFAEEDYIFDEVKAFVDGADQVVLEGIIYSIEGWSKYADDETIRRRIKTALKRLGYRVSRNNRANALSQELSRCPISVQKRRPRFWEKKS